MGNDLQPPEQADHLRAQVAARAQRQEADDTAWLMSGKRGRRIVWRLLERAGVFHAVFTPDALGMAFTAGCRNEGLRLLAAVHTLPDYQLMVAENVAQPAAPQPNEDDA